MGRPQSNRLETDSSCAVRWIASEIRSAIESKRMFGVFLTASVAWIESVMTSSFSFDDAMRAAAPRLFDVPLVSMTTPR